MEISQHQHILVVEDSPRVSRGIREALKREGYGVSCCELGREALEFVRHQAVNMIILDLGLPDGDGIELMPDLQEVSGNIPVLMLTARDGVEDRVKGLDAGAEDYLVKPFAVPELLARVRRILRRPTLANQSLYCGSLRIDTDKHLAWDNDESLELSPREFSLLRLLMEQKGRIVSRSMIAEDVWQAPNRFTPLDNVIEVCVSRLRDKIDRDKAEKLLMTIRGAGYMLRDPE